MFKKAIYDQPNSIFEFIPKALSRMTFITRVKFNFRSGYCVSTRGPISCWLGKKCTIKDRFQVLCKSDHHSSELKLLQETFSLIYFNFLLIFLRKRCDEKGRFVYSMFLFPAARKMKILNIISSKQECITFWIQI